MSQGHDRPTSTRGTVAVTGNRMQRLCERLDRLHMRDGRGPSPIATRLRSLSQRRGVVAFARRVILNGRPLVQFRDVGAAAWPPDLAVEPEDVLACGLIV